MQLTTMSLILLTIVTTLLVPPISTAPLSSLDSLTDSGANALGATSLVSSTKAAPPSSLHTRDSVNPGEQSCTARDRGILVINYAIHIGAPFNQTKCNKAIELLKANAGVVSWARCYDDEEGGTWLKFNDLPGWGDEINEQCTEVWGDEINGFNCPQYRVSNNGTAASNGTHEAMMMGSERKARMARGKV